MNPNLARIASVTFAFGFFISCGSLERTTTSTTTSTAIESEERIAAELADYVQTSDELLKQGQVEDALQALEQVKLSTSPQAGQYYEQIAYLNSRTGDYTTASEWYIKAIKWKNDHTEQTLLPIGNDISRGSLLNLYHGAINALTESGQINEAIFYLEFLAGIIDESQLYHEMLIIQYFNMMRSNALDKFGSINLNTIENNIGQIQRHVLATPGSMLFTGNEYTDLASGHIDLQNELHEDYDPKLDSVVSILIEEARSLYTQILEIDPDYEDAIYGMASTFMLVGNEGEANKWLELLD